MILFHSICKWWL